MRYQDATTVIPAPLADVEGWLRHVESWPRFLISLDSVEKLGHERYRFGLADGRDRRDVVVCLRHLPAVHRFTWRSLEGPRFVGLVELRAVDEGHTAARLSLVAHPGSFLAGLAEMTMPRMDRAAHNLRNLEHEVLLAS